MAARGSFRVTPRSARKPRPTLSPRQWDVVELLHRDLTNKAIAGELGISERAVEELLARARRRLGVETTRRLLARAGARPRPEHDGPSGFHIWKSTSTAETPPG